MVWLAFLAGPLAWTAHSLISSALVPVACHATGSWLLHGVTLGAELVALAGLGLGVRSYTSAPRAGRHFLAIASILTDSLFAFVILVEGIPNFLLSPCWA